MLLRSRIVYPVAAPPLQDGAVRIFEGRIVEVGRYQDLRSDDHEAVFDLGERILLPGFINAHCHLDYTSFAGLIRPPSGFTEWVQHLISLKAQCSYTDYAESWIKGLRQSMAHGTTTICDIEAVPELLPDLLPEVRLRMVSCLEMISVRSKAPAEVVVQEAVQTLRRLPPHRHRVGLSPHAPYSTSQELVRHAARAVEAQDWLWTMHVAESSEEQSMFEHRQGPMYHWLKNQRENSDLGSISPVGWVQATGALSDRALLAHVNCITDAEARALSSTQASIVHCPRSHDYFSHPEFPAERLRDAGVNLCLGTDSLASHPSTKRSPANLDMLGEMRAFSLRHVSFTPREIIEMATTHAARALRLTHETGRIAPGLSADLIALPYSGSADHASEAILQHSGPVDASMVFGEWIQTPPQG